MISQKYISLGSPLGVYNSGGLGWSLGIFVCVKHIPWVILYLGIPVLSIREAFSPESSALELLEEPLHICPWVTTAPTVLLQLL